MTPEQMKSILAEGLNEFRAEIEKNISDLRAELTKTELIEPVTPANGDASSLQPILDAIASLSETVANLQKEIGDEGLGKVLELALGRVENLEKHAAGRQSLSGQESDAGDGDAPTAPTLKDVLAKALKGEKVTIV